MTRFLFDTSVLSELAPGRRGLPGPWTRHLAGLDDGILVSAVSIAEIEEGIGKLLRAQAVRRAEMLSAWLGEFVDDFGPDILPVDTNLAQRIGRLSDRASSIGRHPGLADVVIAATAQAHDLILLTRNLRHFEPLGTVALDPFADPPP